VPEDITLHDYRESSGKQREFCRLLKSQRQAVGLYGGAGGAGKSRCARTAALDILGTLARLGFENQRVVLSCATYPLLRDRHFGKLNEEFEGMGSVKSDHQIHGHCFLFDDKRLGAICLRNLDDPDKYRGTECVASLVDEITEIPAEVGGYRTIDCLLYPIRTTLDVPFLPFGCFSNPDGIGYSWVKSLFIDRNLTDLGLKDDQVFFLPARIEDNPKATPEMYARLDALTGVLYKSRRLGLWDAPEGARFPQLDRQKHLFKMRDVWPNGLPQDAWLFMGLDWGSHAPYCALWFALWDGQIWCFREDYMGKLGTSVQADRVANLTGQNERINILRADPSMWANPASDDDYPGGPPKIEYFRKRLRGDTRFVQIGKGYNKDRSQSFETLDHLLSQDNEYPNLYIEEGCTNFWRELSGAVWDTVGYLSGKREDIDKRCPDHALTAAYYALHAHLHPESVKDDDLVIDWAAIQAEKLRKELHDSERRLSGKNGLWGR
jgi:hypothetical protein